MIFLTDSVREVIPAYSTITEIRSALRYSILPCPNGCFLSGCLPASFVPMIVIRDEPASDRLFTASSTMAMECVISPTAALNPASAALAPMPIMLVLMICFSLVCERSAGTLSSVPSIF